MEEILTKRETIKFLNIALSTLNDMMHKKKIPYVKISGRRVGFLKSDLDDYIQKNRVPAQE